MFGILFLFLANPSAAQTASEERISILGADSLHGASFGGIRMNRLFGNVRLRDRDRVFASDSAYHFPDLDRIQAWGNIEITGPKETLWADSLLYISADDTGRLHGRVVIVQDSITLFSRLAVYNFTDETATFPEPLQLRDAKSLLQADSGIFYNLADSAVFRGQVQLADSSSYLEGDSLFYKRDVGRYWMRGRIFAESASDSLSLSGEEVYGDSTGYRRIMGQALIERVRGAEPDTSYVRGDTVEYFRRGDSYDMSGFGNATIWNGAYAALADSVLYSDSLQTVTLQGDSRIWRDRLQLSAGRQTIFITEGEIDSLAAAMQPFAAWEDSITARIHQLSGRTITAHFDSSALARIDVPEDAELLYFPVGENDQPDGAIRVRMQWLRIRFVESEIDQLDGKGAPNGEVYEEEQQPEALRLEGFLWEPERKPERPTARPLPRWRKADPGAFPIELPPGYLRYLEGVKPPPP